MVTSPYPSPLLEIGLDLLNVELGAWHSPSVWNATRAKLSLLSYPTQAIQLASRDTPVASHHEDTAVIRQALDSLIVLEGKDVVLVMHSYGGLAGTNAVSGLEKSARSAQGERGGITHCLFIAAFLVPKGSSLLGMFPEPPPYLKPDVGQALFLIGTIEWLMIITAGGRELCGDCRP